MELKRDVYVKSVRDISDDKEGEPELLEKRIVSMESEDGVKVKLEGLPDTLQGFRTASKVTLVVKDIQMRLPTEEKG